MHTCTLYILIEEYHQTTNPTTCTLTAHFLIQYEAYPHSNRSPTINCMDDVLIPPHLPNLGAETMLSHFTHDMLDVYRTLKQQISGLRDVIGHIKRGPDSLAKA